MDKDDAAMQKRLEVIARTVREKRAGMDLPVSEIYKLAGVGRETWADIESAKPPLKDERIYGRIARLFDIPLSELMHAAPLEATEITQLVADVRDELRGLRDEMKRMGDAYERLAGAPLAPSSPSAPPPPHAPRAARSTTAAIPHKIRP